MNSAVVVAVKFRLAHRGPLPTEMLLWKPQKKNRAGSRRRVPSYLQQIGKIPLFSLYTRTSMCNLAAGTSLVGFRRTACLLRLYRALQEIDSPPRHFRGLYSGNTFADYRCVL